MSYESKPRKLTPEDTTEIVVKELRKDMESLNYTAHETLDLVKSTSNRVDTLWETIFGRKINGHKSEGIVERVETLEPTVRTLRTVISVAKVLALTFATATAALGTNLIVWGITGG